MAIESQSAKKSDNQQSKSLFLQKSRRVLQYNDVNQSITDRKGENLMKKLLALLLSALMLTSALACAGSVLAEEDLREKELVTLDVVMMASAGKEGADEVVEAVNKILEEKLNVHINLTFISYGNYAQQTNLMLSAGEGIDLLPVYLTPLSTFAQNGQILPLDDLLAEYGQGIIDWFGMDAIKCGMVGDELFGLIAARESCNAYGFEMRKDICDKYGIDYENITTLEQLEEALRIVHEAEPNLVCVVPSNGELTRNWNWDPLGDELTPLGVLLDKGKEPVVVNLFESDFYRDFVTTMRRWYNDGLIMADGASTTESVGVMMGAGTAFGGFMNLKPGFDLQETRNYGTEIVVSELVSEFSYTSRLSAVTWAISSSCKHPEAAMKLLNLLYTDSELMNLLIYGLEGTHYVKIGDAAMGQSIITYPDGVDINTTTYRPSGSWLWPNQYISHVWEGNPADYWQSLKAFSENSEKSVAFGFSWDSSKVKNQLTACTNVVAKYHKALMCGSLDPEETLPKFNAELKSAGIDDIIADKQAQLDAWLEINGK